MLITLFAYVDRQIFVLMAEPIRRSMQLDDFELGLLQGLGIALFAAVGGYPLGWLADRFDRRLVLSACLATWSLAVVACGLSQTFTQLFVASAVVGVGEAGVVPVVYGLIPELFHGKRRPLANSIYAVSTRVGIGIAIALCGYLISSVDLVRPLLPDSLRALDSWRLAFLGAALPAVPLVLLPLLIPRTTRGASEVRGAAAHQARLAPYVWENRRVVLGFLGAIGVAAFGFASVITWIPVIVIRMYGETPASAGRATGVATLVATGVGFAIGATLLRTLGSRLGARLPVITLAVSSVCAAIASFALLYARSAAQVYVLQGVQLASAIAGLMVYPTALQDISPSHLRSRIVSLDGIARVVLGALSSAIVGALSDRFAPRADALVLAAVVTSVTALLLAALMFSWTISGFERTVLVARAASRTVT